MPRKTPSPETVMLVDSVLPAHIIRNRTHFSSYTPGLRNVQTAFGTIAVEGAGTVVIKVTGSAKSIHLTLSDVWHVPSSAQDFFSSIHSSNLLLQIILAQRGSRIIISPTLRLSNPSIPKYIPLSRINGQFFVKVEFMPLATSSTSTRTVMRPPAVAATVFVGGLPLA
ncbi:hypothetical protein BDZ89DRAFT_1152693 [Hymenopellis radicata]|nr:hypothetical protein BDZ89DRAFT_1152693 [Hymenopellis radicata]